MGVKVRSRRLYPWRQSPNAKAMLRRPTYSRFLPFLSSRSITPSLM